MMNHVWITFKCNSLTAKSKILEEVYRFKSEFVSEKELQDAKDRIAGAYIIGLESLF